MKVTQEHVRPLYDEILVKPAPRAPKHESLFLPDGTEQVIQEGLVVLVGEGAIGKQGKRIPMTIKPGDTILFGKHWDREIEFRGEKLVTVKEKDTIGIIVAEGKEGGSRRLDPIYNNVIIKPDPLPEKFGTLWIPQSAQSKPKMGTMTGEVLDCGPGHRMKDGTIQPLDVKPGDRVVFEPFGGEDHTFSGEHVRLIPEEHILAFV